MSTLALLASLSAPASASDPPRLVEASESGGGIVATFREDRGHVVVLDVAGDYDFFDDGGLPNVAARQAVATELLTAHADEYDFVLTFTSFPFELGTGVRARYVGVRNDVSGIGLPLFDYSAAFGSDGVLQGFLDLGALSTYALDGSPIELEASLQIAAHEILHRWGAYVRFRDAEGSLRTDLMTGGGHWSYLAQTSGSLLYGNHWRDNGDGSFQSLDAVKVASALDLYLAGFLAADEVPPFFLIRNQGIDPERPARIGDIVTGTKESISVADVVAAEGTRLPASDSAQREFRAALVYLARPGEPISEDAFAALESLRRELLSRFAILTGGRGRMEIHPVAAGGPEPGEADPVEGGEIRPSSADLGDAADWLAARQESAGSWSDHDGTRSRDTDAAARALRTAGRSFDLPAARSWAIAATPVSLDGRARVATLLDGLDQQPELLAARAAIGQLQNVDGGWGAAALYESDPLDTALALNVEPSGHDGDAAIVSLLSAQNADGSWGTVRAGSGGVLATVEALRAVARRGLAEPTAAGLAWLAAQQNSDGGFGSSPSTAHATAEVLLLLRELGQSNVVDDVAALDYLRARQTVEGSWEGSVYATAKALEALLAADLPDWFVVAAPIAEPSEPTLGEPVAIRLRVGNGGAAPLPAGIVRFFDGEPGLGGVPIGGDRPLPPLASGEEVEVIGSWPEAAPEGEHVLHVVVDPGSQVPEADEANNEASVAVAVGEASNGPDLELRNEAISFTPASPNLLPSTVTVSVTLFNRGNEAVPDARVRLWIGDPVAGMLVGDQSVPVGASSSVPVHFPVELTAPGPIRFSAIADPDDAIVEARETNNAAARDLSTSPSIDLEVLSSDVALLDPPYPGADVRFAVTLRNRGTLSTPLFPVRYEILDGEETLLVDEGELTLGPGATASRTVSWRVTRSGDLHFRVVVDAAGEIVEVDETNNSASLPFVAGAPDVPNLTVSHVDLAFAPEPALEGSPLTISALVRNTGGVEAPPSEVAFYDGDPGNGGLHVGTTGVGAIAPGASTTAVFVWTNVPDPGDRFLHVASDPADAVAELDEEDNSAFRPLEVLSLPDAALGPGSVSLLPAFPVPGQTVVVSIESANLGEQPLVGLAARAFLGDPEEGGVAVGSDVAFPTLAGGESAIAQLSFSFPEVAATAELVVLVDFDATITEGDEGNNRTVVAFSIQDTDAYVTERYISPNGDGVRDATRFSFRLHSPATVAVEIRDRWGTLVRRVIDPAWTEVVEGSFTWDGTTDLGRVARDGDHTFVVVSESGTALGQAWVTVDTNRSSMVDAVGTAYESIENLTCAIQYPLYPLRPQLTADERSAFLHYDWGTPGQPVGIYRMDGRGGSLQTVLGTSWFASQGAGDAPDRPSEIWPSDSGAFVAFSQFRCGCGNCLNCSGTSRKLFLTTASGANTRELPIPGSNSEILGFFDGDRKLLAIRGGTGDLVSLSTGAPTPAQPIYAPNGSLGFGYLSPDRRKVVVQVDYPEGPAVDLVDLASGEGQTLLFEDALPVDDGLPIWSRDGALLALWSPQMGRILSFAATGQVRSDLAIPSSETADAEVDWVSLLGYSTWSDELALQVYFSQACGSWSEIFSIDLETEEVRRLGENGRPESCAMAVVSLAVGDEWLEVGRIGSGPAGPLRGLTIPSALVEGERVRLRVRSEGMAALDIDHLELWVGRTRAVLVGDPDEDPHAPGAPASRREPVRLRAIEEHEVEWHLNRSGRIVLRAAIWPARPRELATMAGETEIWSEIAGPWIPNDRALHTNWDFDAAPQFAYRLDPGAEPRRLLAGFESIEIPQLSPTGRRLLFNSRDPGEDPESACYDSGPDTLAVENWLNLGTELVARREPGVSGVLLSGTAADRSFARYRLEYAIAGGVPSWLPIAPPSTREVFGEPFQTWIPPGPGVFVVRLSTEDRAGNVRSVTQRVYSADTPTLTDFLVTPEVFSPNGDGVLDETTVSYRLLEPANLAFTLVDSGGQVIRTFSRSHPAPGEFSFDWDGRNSAGFRVADATYRFRVLGYEQLVRVDTTPASLPPIELEAISHCTEQVPPPSGRHLSVTYSLVPPLQDQPAGTLFQRGLAPTPSSWEAAASTGIPFTEAAAHLYRTFNDDQWGNIAISLAEPPPAFVFLGAASPQPSGTPNGFPGPVMCPRQPVTEPDPVVPDNGLLRLEVLESLDASLTVDSIRVVSNQSGSCSFGAASAMSFEPLATYMVGHAVPWGSLAPDQAFEVLWSSSTLEAGLYCVRIEGLTSEGEPWVSTTLEVVVEVEPTRLELSGSASEASLATLAGPFGDLYRHAIAAGAFETGDARFYFGEIVGDDPVADVELILASEEDPRYEPPARFAPAFGESRRLLFRQDLWEACTDYVARLEGRRFAPDGTAGAISSTPISGQADCVEVEAEVRPDWVVDCGETPSGDLLFEIRPRAASSEVELAQLTLGLLRPDGQEEVWTSWNQPTSDAEYEYRLDTSELAEGSHLYRARLVSTAGEEGAHLGRIFVTRTAPAIEFTQPIDGEQLCAQDAEARWTITDQSDLLCIFEASPPPNCPHNDLYSVCGLPEAWPPDEDAGCHAGSMGLSGSHGLQELHLEAVGWSGHLSCAVRTVEVDGMSEGLAALTGPSLFSPNGDSRFDSTTLVANVAETMTVAVAIHPAAPLSGGDWLALSPPVRTLLDGVAVFDSRAAEWDGEDDSGFAVPDGNYLAVVGLRDGCANLTRQQILLKVDTTPPAVTIDYPLPGDPLPMLVNVRGAIVEEHPAGYQLFVGAGADPSSWLLLRSGSGAPPTPIVGTWNTYGLAGTFTLRLVAEDLAGNVGESRSTVVLEAPFRLLSYLESVPPLFSPNGDGRREESAIRFGVEDDAVVSVRVTTPGGATVRQLLTSQPMVPGAGLVAWNGNSAGDTPAPDGEYRALVDAALAGDPDVTQSEWVPILLDRTPPTVEITRPSAGFVSGRGSVVGTIVDAHLASYSVELAVGSTPGAWVEIDAGAANRQNAPLGSLEGLGEGPHWLRVRSEDQAEIRVERLVEFTVDNTPPVASLETPSGESIHGAVDGPVEVRGSVVELHPASWKLDVGAGDTPSAWSEVAGGEGSPAAPLLAAWSIAGLPDGAYTLRLTALDRAGSSGEARVRVLVDNTPPVAAIDAPAADAFVRAATAILGTATDATLAGFNLGVAPEGSPLYSEIASGNTPVTGGQIGLWAALPPDGRYRLRLDVLDRAGNSARVERSVTVDQAPPAAPTLQAALENGDDARLHWTASPEADVVGYEVDRDGVTIPGAPLTTTTHLDPDLGDGQHRYVVRAVDRAGWRSAPSNEATVAVDRTPPLVRLFEPTSGEHVSGTVEIVGTAASGADFRELRLLATPLSGGASLLLARSGEPVEAAVVGLWSTSGLAEGSIHRLRLEADDQAGNLGFEEVDVVVDNDAPAPPTNLTATVPGGTSHVQLGWTASISLDVDGYLLYRDGALVNAEGGAPADLRAYLLRATSYLDASRPDGTFSYVVLAMDLAGNLSAPSNEAEATVSRHAPHAIIVEPVDGATIEGAVEVLAVTADEDVVEARFQYRALGGPSWIDLLPVDVEAPWSTLFDPAGYDPPLAFGDYEIQAVARDATDLVDPGPTPIRVTYTELAAPDAPAGLAAAVDGGDVTLTWSVGGEPDLEGYAIERFDGEGEPATWTRLTVDPIPAPPYFDQGLADAAYRYRVLAVDVTGNESPPSSEAAALVHTPRLRQPYTPTEARSTVLSGRSVALATAELVVTNGVGSSEPRETAIDAAGAFELLDVALALGDNALAVRVEDPSGNRSKTATVRVWSGDRPSAPSGLTATPGAGDHDVDLEWNANSEADLLGYRVRRSGDAFPPAAAVAGVSASASSSQPWAPPAAALDGDAATTWEPAEQGAQPIAGEWLELGLGEVRVVERVSLDWFDHDGVVSGASAFDLLGWDGRAWVPLAEVRDNAVSVSAIELARPYRTDRLRLEILAAIEPPVGDSYVALGEVEAIELPTIAATTWSDSAPDGAHAYTVTAWNALGFESDPSSAAPIEVGDAEPPLAVVLSATAAGADVELSWTASASPDVARYDLYRDGAKIAEHTDLELRVAFDLARPNGTYLYAVRPVDAVGNAGAYSNEVAIIIDVPPPPISFDLAVSEVPTGGALDLAWQEPADAPPAAYRIYRSLSSGGGFVLVAELPTRAHRDLGLSDGVTYFYQVAAVDAGGVATARSNEASGTPRDRVVDPPAIHLPTVAGLPLEWPAPSAPIGGTAEPGAAVSIYRNGVWVGSTSARVEDQATDLALPGYPELLRAAPDGRAWLWVDDEGEAHLTTATGEAAEIADPEARWSWRERTLWTVGAGGEALAELDLDGSVRRAVALPGLASFVVPGPSEQLATALTGAGGTGLFRLDLESGETSLVHEADLAELDGGAVTWSPRGQAIALVQGSGGESRLLVVHLDPDGAWSEELDAAAAREAPSWSPDGERLYWTSSTAGVEQVWRWDRISGTTTALTDSVAGRHAAQASPAGDRIAMVDWNGELRLVDVATGDEVVLHDFGIDNLWPRLDWSSSGALFALDRGQALRFDLSGQFRHPAIPLSGGTNEISARATDLAGNASAPSVAIELEVPPESAPNLSILPGDLTHWPQAPLAGSIVRISVTVRNSGASTAPASVLSVVLQTPEGEATPVAAAEAMPALVPGATVTRAFDVALPPAGGAYFVRAAIDPDDVIAELDESDNRASRQLVVMELSAPAVTVESDRAEYGAGATVALTIGLTNGGPAFHGRLRVRIEDGEGFEVVELLDQAIVDLPYGANLSIAASWPSGEVFAGDYQARAELEDSEGTLVSTDLAAFTIGEQLALLATIATDRADYVVGDDLAVVVTFDYAAGNSILSGVEARIRLARDGGAIAREWTVALGALLPGSGGTIERAWSSDGEAPGPFTARVELVRGAVELAAASAPFAILPAPPRFAGTLELAPANPSLGDAVQAAWSLTLDGGAPLPDAIARVALVDPSTGEVLAAHDLEEELTPGQPLGGSVEFATADLALRSYLVVLSLDPDGGAPLEAPLSIAVAAFTTADRTAPLLNVVRPGPGGLLGGSLDGLASAIDEHSSVERVDLRIDEGTWVRLPLVDAPSGLYGRALDELAEGAHVLVARATDVWGNARESAAISFEVDLTPPAIAVEGIAEGGSYSAPVIPVVSVTDLHPGWEVVALDQQPFISGTTVAEPGAHTLRVVAEDGAGNRAEVSVTFEIALAAPAVSLSKSAALALDGDADGQPSPGDEIEYSLVVSSIGESAATTLQVVDPIPAHTALVPGSVETTVGSVAGFDPLTVEIESLAAAAAATIRFRVGIELDFPPTELEISNQATATATGVSPVTSDDPSTAAANDPTRTEVFIIPSISAADVETGESSESAEIELALSRQSNRQTRVAFVSADGSAEAGSDYLAVEGEVEVPPGELTASIAVPLVDDSDVEGPESFRIELSAPENGTLPDPTAVVTLLDDDLPTVSLSDVELAEGSSGGVLVTVVPPSTSEIGLTFATEPGSATEGVDYVHVEGELVVPTGVESVSIPVTTLEDFLDEPAEEFRMRLITASGALLGDDLASITIGDDDGPPSLAATKTAEILGPDRKLNPGDRLRYTIVLTSTGGSLLTGIRLTDELPCTIVLVPGSVTTTAGTVLDESPIEVEVGALDPGASATIVFEAEVVITGADPPLELAISNQGFVGAVELPDLLTDDPALPGTSDPTVVPLYGRRIFVDGFESGGVDRWPLADRVFADGFGCGNLATWSSNVPEPGAPRAVRPAELAPAPAAIPDFVQRLHGAQGRMK